MKNLIGLVADYKSNIPLNMLSNKYSVPIHTIIKVLHALIIKGNDDKRATASV